MRLGQKMACAALLAGLVLSTGVCAQEKAAGLNERNDQAVQLSQDGKLIEAAAIWLDLIDEVGPDNQYLWGFHMNVGRNFQKLALFPEAWWHLRRSVTLNPGEKTRALEWLAEVEKTLLQTHRRITVVVGHAGGRVRFLHGTRETWYKAPLEWWFKPGEQSIDVAAEGVERTTRQFSVGPQTTEVVLRLDQGAGGDPIVKPAGTVESKKGRPVLPWVMLGGAFLLAGAGGATFWVASNNLETEKKDFAEWKDEKWGLDGLVPSGKEGEAEDEWDSRMSSKVTPYEITSYALWGAAGAAAVGSIVWLAVDAAREREPEGDLRPVFVPLLTPGGAGAAAQLTF